MITDKITTRHLELRAYVYVRQSTSRQVQHNLASQQNQYALVQRATDLGWLPNSVRVIDTDLGQSGTDGERAGFKELVSEVSLGHVGIILSYEASRLARNNADWYRLLDIAGITGALIADTDGVYDPAQYNDRLLLGLRGMLSEAELHLLRLRMDAGRMRQVEEGTYRQRLPTGLVRLENGRVAKDPNERVQRMISLGSVSKVLRYLAEHELMMPRVQASGPMAGQLVWKPPSESHVYETLRNPAYAGAFVYGRKAPVPHRLGARQQRTLEEISLLGAPEDSQVAHLFEPAC